MKRNSSGPWVRSVASMTASIAATPMPLSEPRVVPVAVMYSPCRCGTIASVPKSNGTSLFLLLHHVEVRLQDRHLRRLLTRASRLADDDIAGGVHRVVEAQSGSGRDHVLPHPRLVLRRARDGEDRVELRPYGGWLQARNKRHAISSGRSVDADRAARCIVSSAVSASVSGREPSATPVPYFTSRMSTEG